ncbi:MAG: hypothetical protein JWM16_3373 [Verrucomicrobiales bacterium]|nr:hypothetical protein [Verrucomicrobiales bacterium]
MKWFLSYCMFLLFGMGVTQAQPAQIIIIRHGEEPGGGSVHLSARGSERAIALASFFSTNAVVNRFGRPVALFAPHPTLTGSKRAYETILPTSQRWHLPVQGTYSQDQYIPLARSLLSNRRYRGRTVIITWIHSWIPQMAGALRVRPQPPAWDPSAYDRFYVITYSAAGQASFEDLPQRLLQGDSER